jgi:hypothetical protein
MEIIANQMKDKLKTVDQLRDVLATTEPLGSLGFPVGDGVRFRVDPAWNHGLEAKAGTELVDAYVNLGSGESKEFQLTKESLLEATSIVGLSKGYASRTPAKYVEPQLNYWFREGLAGKDFKLLTVGDEMGAAFTRATVEPFSNLRLLDETVAGIQEQYGSDAEILVDYKLDHGLPRTAFRLIVPEKSRVIENTGTSNDTWSVGLQVKNSLIGLDQTEVSGYLFRWWCTNGCINTMASSGTWSRRGGGQGDEVYSWARESVDSVLGGLEHALDQVQDLTSVEIDGETTEVLRDIFTQYRIPVPQRESIIANMVEVTDLTMYSVMQAITQAANASDIAPGHAEALMRAGGDIPSSVHDRCDSCRRLVVG